MIKITTQMKIMKEVPMTLSNNYLFLIFAFVFPVIIFAQKSNDFIYCYTIDYEKYYINYSIGRCDEWFCQGTDTVQTVFDLSKRYKKAYRPTIILGDWLERSPNNPNTTCGICEGNKIPTGYGQYGQNYKSCLSFFTYNFHCEDMIPFDCRYEGVMQEPIYISWFDVYIACSGFYYLDTAQHYKVYQFEYYKQKALNPRKKEMVLKMAFCPKIGVIRQQAFKERAESKNYRKYPLLQKVRLLFGRPRRLFDMNLSTINQIPLSQIIQKDTCFTPFCDIDKVGCE